MPNWQVQLHKPVILFVVVCHFFTFEFPVLNLVDWHGFGSKLNFASLASWAKKIEPIPCQSTSLRLETL